MFLFLLPKTSENQNAETKISVFIHRLLAEHLNLLHLHIYQQNIGNGMLSLKRPLKF